MSSATLRVGNAVCAIRWNVPQPVEGEDFLRPVLGYECKDHPDVRGTSYSEVAELLGSSGCSRQEPWWSWSVLGVLETERGKIVIGPGDWIISDPKTNRFIAALTVEEFDSLYPKHWRDRVGKSFAPDACGNVEVDDADKRVLNGILDSALVSRVDADMAFRFAHQALTNQLERWFRSKHHATRLYVEDIYRGANNRIVLTVNPPRRPIIKQGDKV